MQYDAWMLVVGVTLLLVGGLFYEDGSSWDNLALSTASVGAVLALAGALMMILGHI